ncbi:thrombospondin type 3 repeat-containing protein [Christiangramia sp.]|uniref:thrombospondin type 3 repeat-containing protein n=1 Tax=Christiangramia sp. TaxID=1931228 RepID=UPI00261D0136|nr:thrombospondin type 3 repeat-containing protein [Christiangramia sp.]
MKIINRCLAYVAVMTLMLTSCSKEESSAVIDDPSGAQSVNLQFGAVLNDLANRGMSKGHFNQVPDCSDEEPAVAVIEFSYGGNNYSTEVDILEDENGFFTDYSDDLKIPVADNSSVTVSLNGFMVYDGDPDDADTELIWIAPKRTANAPNNQFAGYVDRSLPFTFEVEDGTKPYINVEVLCFDRRMVNEYGYVFFNILPEEIVPLCLFVNYCDENGRHFVADYSVDLYFGTDDSGIQLYDHNQDMGAMATTGTRDNGEYYADPLCLVVPGPPANLDDDEPYLYLIIYPEDWDGTGDIDNTPVPVQLTWEAVNDLLNGDGTTNEYLHLLIGECEDALEGDETIGGGNGNGDNCPGDTEGDGCDDDDDGDGVIDRNDNCPNTPDEVEPGEVDGNGCPLDSDNDGVDDYLDECSNTPAGATVNNVGCQVNGGGDPDFTCNFTTDTDCTTWDFDQSEETPDAITGSYNILEGTDLIGVVTITTDDGDVIVDVGMQFGHLIDDLGVIIDDGTEQCLSDLGGLTNRTVTFAGNHGVQNNVQILLNYCPAN